MRIGDTLHPNVAWTYRTPFPECDRIAGMIAFYDEKVDVSVEPPGFTPALDRSSG